ncbi:MAG TPA: lipopolysaccharide kinase InaA family protein, partial [Longimicrobiales bacterium]|nr:lipopolysaccharide kinase InaA family protein [Longimicrobiales bacterium]
HAAAAAVPGAESFAGRGAAYRMRSADGDWLVRHYRRGGLVARVLDEEYLRVGVPRPLRELRASAAARSRGVATPQVVAAITYPAGPFYRADLATTFIEDGADLADITFGSEQDAVQDGVREAAWRAAGALLSTAFAAGVDHADLNLRNILVTAGGTAYLLDLDRAIVHEGSVSDVARNRMLERLHRSRRKLESIHGRPVGQTELRAFEGAL